MGKGHREQSIRRKRSIPKRQRRCARTNPRRYRYIKEPIPQTSATRRQKGTPTHCFESELLQADPKTIAAVPEPTRHDHKCCRSILTRSTRSNVVMATHETRAPSNLKQFYGLYGHRQDRRSERQKGWSKEAIPRRRKTRRPGELSQDATSKPEKPRRIARPTALKEGRRFQSRRKCINLVLLQATRTKRPPTIHFEPFETRLKSAIAEDGVLYEDDAPPAHIAPALSSRVKVLANLDIASARPDSARKSDLELNVQKPARDLRWPTPTIGRRVRRHARCSIAGNVASNSTSRHARGNLTPFRQLIHKQTESCA